MDNALIPEGVKRDPLWKFLMKLGPVVVVLAWAWLGHRVLGDKDYPSRWW